MTSAKYVTNPTKFKLYKKRWFLLSLFVLYAFNGALQWTQFTTIDNLVTKYYNVSNLQVTWTANVFILAFIILAVPSLYLIDLMGLKNILLLSTFGCAVGNWIKLFSVAPDENEFYVTFFGQLLCGSFLKLTYGTFTRFTAFWFEVDEISTAGVLIVLGYHTGSAFGYILPTIMVKDGSKEDIGKGLKNMHLCVSISTTMIFFLFLFYLMYCLQRTEQVKHDKIFPTLCKIMKNPAVLLFFVSYGMNCAPSTSVAIFLNEIILANFPDASDSDVGNIGFVMMLGGVPFSLVIGKLLDKTRLFKEYSVFLTVCTTISMIMFTCSLRSGSILVVYGTTLLVGGYYSSGVQLGIELTYPIHEEITTTITLLSGELFSLIITVIYGNVMDTYGYLISNIGMVVLNSIAVLATLSIPVDLKRQKAENEPNIDEIEIPN